MKNADYSKLKGRLAEKGQTQKSVAIALGVSDRSISSKMNNESDWSQTEILMVSKFLDIPIENVHLYFFKQIVR